MKILKLLPLLLIPLFFFNCNTTPKTAGVNVAYMDQTVAPKDDFFRFVNGTWLDQTAIPDDKTRWGSFDELREMTRADVMEILENAATAASKKPDNSNSIEKTDQEKAIGLYRLILDVEGRNAKGLKPLDPFLERIDALSSLQDLQSYLIATEPYGGGGIISFWVWADDKDSNKNVAHLGAGPVGLPDRDYYLNDDEASLEIKSQYEAHIQKMMALVGFSEEKAKSFSENVLDLETQMAAARLDKVSRRDPRKTYNPMTVSELQKTANTFDWKAYFSGIGVAEESIVVSDKGYYQALDKMLTENSLGAWKDYLKWTLVNEAAGYLTEEMDRMNWEFYGKTLRGAEAQEPLNERAIQTVNWTLGEAMGKLYVDEKFPPEAKQQMEELVHNLVRAYTNRINALPWMDEATKAKAIEKLTKMTVKVGYPDTWKDYGKLRFKDVENKGSYFDAMLAIAKFNFEEDLEDLKKPVDKTQWFMAPQIVNAYYNPSYNEIVFPAAILQPPFFNFHADAAVNYGGIGAVIGHEISHGFDDSGADYDADGNLENWWTDEDLEQFNSLGDKLADQYSAIEVLPDVFINGKFTLGENIGDLGGVNAAYDALQLHHADHGKPEAIDGFTAEQRFFISWATVWRTKIREEALKNQVRTDPHSPGVQRAVQTLKNVDAFYEAFQIQEQDSMYISSDERVYIW